MPVNVNNIDSRSKVIMPVDMNMTFLFFFINMMFLESKNSPNLLKQNCFSLYYYNIIF